MRPGKSSIRICTKRSRTSPAMKFPKAPSFARCGAVTSSRIAFCGRRVLSSRVGRRKIIRNRARAPARDRFFIFRCVKFEHEHEHDYDYELKTMPAEKRD